MSLFTIFHRGADVRGGKCPTLRISSNLAYLFISTGPILIIKMCGLGAISMRVISLCNS